jgi:tetratricopeptide (TPR) repeat protein
MTPGANGKHARRTITAVASTAAFALAISCSSAPPKSDTVAIVRNQAAEASVFGNAYFQQGRYDLALQSFTRALEYNTSVDNTEGIIRSYDSIGRVHMALGELERAAEFFSRAREMARGQGGTLLFMSTNSLGEAYLRRGEPQKALATFEEALAIPGAKLTAEQIAILSHNLGTAHMNLGNDSRALELLAKALAANLANKLFEAAAANCYMMASIRAKQGDFSGARSDAERALRYDKQIENSSGIILDLYALGTIASRSGDREASLDFFRRSYLVATTLGAKAQTRKALERLVETAEALGLNEEAEGYRKALEELGDR